MSTITLSLTTRTDLSLNNLNRSTLIDSAVQDTLATAFYGIIEGDISSLDGTNASIVDSLDSTYRKFIPATFDILTNSWVFNKIKAKNLRNKLNVQLSVTTFEEFLDAINLVEKTNELIKEMNAEQETTEQKEIKADLKVTKYFQKAIADGMSVTHLESLLASVKAAQGNQKALQDEFARRLADKLAA